MEKKLFAYYSLSGNGDAVADRMRELGYEILKVETKKPMPKSFFLRILSGGFQAGTRKKAELLPVTCDLSAYPEIVIGSPVWNGRLTPAVNTLLDMLPEGRTPKAFVLWSGGGSAPKAFQDLLTAFPDAPVIELKEPRSNPEELAKLAF